MKSAVYNVQTGKTTYEEFADIEMPTETFVPEPTEAERITSLENAILDLILGGA